MITRLTNIKSIAAIMMLAALLLTCVGCSNSNDVSRMSDDEIRQAIEEGDKATLEQAKADTKVAIEEAFQGFDFGSLSDDQIEALRARILDGVDQKVGNTTVVNRYETVESKKPSPEHPRIKDGTAIPITWNAEKTLTKNLTDDIKATYTINKVEAKAYNYAKDTPYAGGGYAYNIEIVANVTLKIERTSDLSMGFYSAGELAEIKVIFTPHDLETSMTCFMPSGIDENEESRTTTEDMSFSMATNSVPKRIVVNSISML